MSVLRIVSIILGTLSGIVGIAFSTLLAVVLVGCSRENEQSKFESKVSVERQIEVKDELLDTTTAWSMTLRPQHLSFARIRPSIDSVGRPNMVSFSDPKEATVALAKFVEWDDRARQNNVEPFRKSLADKCTFEFSHGASTLEYYWKTPYGTFSGEFSRADVDKFNELLKQLPQAKAELEGKIAKAQKEEALFKSENVPSQQPTTQPLPSQVQRWATLVQRVSIQTPSGQVIELPIGTRLECVTWNSSEIRIRYAGAEYNISADFAVIQ